LAFGSDSKRLEVAVTQDFTLNDFRRQLDQIPKMGMKDLLGSTPAPSEEDLDLALHRLRQMINATTDEERHMIQFIWQSVQIRQMIDAMTDEERSNPDLIDSSQRKRIASSSGTQPQEVEKLLAQFHQVRALMRQVASMNLWQRIKLVLGFAKSPGQEAEPN
jgi:signal recognition particle subunit SRP54